MGAGDKSVVVVGENKKPFTVNGRKDYRGHPGYCFFFCYLGDNLHCLFSCKRQQLHLQLRRQEGHQLSFF